ncbi:MAG: heme-binding protein, partial [Sphingobium sp.]
MKRVSALLAGAALILSSCGGGGSSSAPTPAPSPTPTPTPAGLYAVPAQEALTVADVETVIARAAAEATARNLPAVIAVTDRVGNVLAIFNMNGARATATTSAAPNGQNIDAQNLTVPAAAGAIAKAITGAYLS